MNTKMLFFLIHVSHPELSAACPGSPGWQLWPQRRPHSDTEARCYHSGGVTSCHSPTQCGSSPARPRWSHRCARGSPACRWRSRTGRRSKRAAPRPRSPAAPWASPAPACPSPPPRSSHTTPAPAGSPPRWASRFPAGRWATSGRAGPGSAWRGGGRSRRALPRAAGGGRPPGWSRPAPPPRSRWPQRSSPPCCRRPVWCFYQTSGTTAGSAAGSPSRRLAGRSRRKRQCEAAHGEGSPGERRRQDPAPSPPRLPCSPIPPRYPTRVPTAWGRKTCDVARGKMSTGIVGNVVYVK